MNGLGSFWTSSEVLENSMGVPLPTPEFCTKSTIFKEKYFFSSNALNRVFVEEVSDLPLQGLVFLKNLCESSLRELRGEFRLENFRTLAVIFWLRGIHPNRLGSGLVWFVLRSCLAGLSVLFIQINIFVLNSCVACCVLCELFESMLAFECCKFWSVVGVKTAPPVWWLLPSKVKLSSLVFLSYIFDVSSMGHSG
jgi:hypothetical protein